MTWDWNALWIWMIVAGLICLIFAAGGYLFGKPD